MLSILNYTRGIQVGDLVVKDVYLPSFVYKVLDIDRNKIHIISIRIIRNGRAVRIPAQMPSLWSSTENNKRIYLDGEEICYL